MDLWSRSSIVKYKVWDFDDFEDWIVEKNEVVFRDSVLDFKCLLDEAQFEEGFPNPRVSVTSFIDEL